jgi:uncharacterized membrane protein HdeD (DUF308 family)
MSTITKRSGTIELLKALIAIILSILIIINPPEALMTLATYFGVIAIITGIIVVVLSLSGKSGFWQIMLFQGIVFTLIGALVIAYPGITASLMIFFIGLLITFLGIIQLIAYLQLREVTTAPKLSLINAIFSIIIGGILLFNPFEGALLATLIVAGYAAWYGISRIYVAWLIFTGKAPK